jgi:uncharacterized OB-fold protein
VTDSLVPVEGRPLPAFDPISSVYWEAAARGELLFQECPACGHRQLYPRALCTVCAQTPSWKLAAGAGTIHTFTVVRQHTAQPFRSWVPYAVAVIELDEGPRLMGGVINCDIEQVHVGMRVSVTFVDAGHDVTLPFWQPS